MKQKLIFNLVFDSIVTAILSFLLSFLPIEFSFWIPISIFTFFFIISSLYGDPQYNITLGWSYKAKKIKRIIGDILVVIFFICFITFLWALVTMASFH